MDRASRAAKARKIEVLVGAERDLDGARVLDVGTGSGVIAARLAEAVGPGGAVWAVDTRDLRVVEEGYEFELVKGVALPFDDAFFDVVVTNHVVEHVGDVADQAEHLREVRRVLRPDGLCYLAAPSRWAVVEPHYRLPLLSWLPERLRSPYVRLARRGEGYDCRPPARDELARLAAAAGLVATEISAEAIRAMAAEGESRAARLAAAAPAPVLSLLASTAPSMVFLLRPAPGQPASSNQRSARV